MPIYEYKCEKCGRKFDLFQKITDMEVKTCNFCNGSVKKLISLSAFHLKGSGWYVTDYGGKKAPASEKHKDEPKPSSTPSESTSKTDGDKA